MIYFPKFCPKFFLRKFQKDLMKIPFQFEYCEGEEKGSRHWKEYVCDEGRVFDPTKKICVHESEYQCPEGSEKVFYFNFESNKQETQKISYFTLRN